MLDTIFAKASRKKVLEGNVVPKAIGQCLETMRSVLLSFFFEYLRLIYFHHVRIVSLASFCPYNSIEESGQTIRVNVFFLRELFFG